MRKQRLGRKTLGQLRYASHAAAAAEQQATEPISLVDPLLFCIEHEERVFTHEDLRCSLTPDPNGYYLFLGDSEILIDEVNQVIDEANQMLAKYPEKRKDEIYFLVCPTDPYITLDRLNIAYNQEYYASESKNGIIKRQQPLTKEEARAFIIENTESRYNPLDDLVDEGSENQQT